MRMNVRRILAAVMAFVLVLGMLPAGAVTAHAAELTFKVAVDGQDAVLEFSRAPALFDVVDVERAAHAATVPFAADVAAALRVFLLLLLVPAGRNGKISVFELRVQIFLLKARELQLHLEVVRELPDIGVHQLAGFLAEAGHRTEIECVVEEIIYKIIGE